MRNDIAVGVSGGVMSLDFHFGVTFDYTLVAAAVDIA